MVKVEIGGIKIPPQLEGQWKLFEDIFIESDSSDCFMKRAEVVNER